MPYSNIRNHKIFNCLKSRSVHIYTPGSSYNLQGRNHLSQHQRSRLSLSHHHGNQAGNKASVPASFHSLSHVPMLHVQHPGWWNTVSCQMEVTLWLHMAIQCLHIGVYLPSTDQPPPITDHDLAIRIQLVHCAFYWLVASCSTKLLLIMLYVSKTKSLTNMQCLFNPFRSY